MLTQTVNFPIRPQIQDKSLVLPLTIRQLSLSGNSTMKTPEPSFNPLLIAGKLCGFVSQSNGALINTEHGKLRRKENRDGLEKKSNLHEREGLKDKRERTDKDGETCESGEREVRGVGVPESDGVMQHTAVVECETDAAQWRVRGQWCL